MKKWFSFLALTLMSLQSQAQNLGGIFSGGNLQGVRTYAGVGFADYDVKNPSGQFKMDQGIYAYIGGERFVNDYGTSVTITLTYMNGDGESSYDYTSGAGVRYAGNNVQFGMNSYGLGLGLKQRFFPSGWFRPYIEGGGLFGYHQLKYDGNLSNITSTDPTNAFKKNDSFTGLGFYGEAGVEIDFSQAYGIRVGGRFQQTETKEIETLANQKIKFEALIYQIALLLRF